MERTLEEIASEALTLRIESRAALAKRLLDSLDEMCLWVEEAARRYQQLRDGTAGSTPVGRSFRAPPSSSALMRSRFHDATEAEFSKRFPTTTQSVDGLGDRFLAEVRAATKYIERYPEIAPLKDEGVRAKILLRFP